MADFNIDFVKCEGCGLSRPASYETCPICVFGIKFDKIGRVTCRNCNTIVGEFYIVDNKREFMEKCDFCDPSPDAKPEDIVSKFGVWFFDPVQPPRRVVVQTTRKERQEQIEDNKKFVDFIMKTYEETEMS